SAMITGPLIGRITDRAGKLPTFLAGSVLSAMMVLYYTRLGATPFVAVATIFSIMFIGIQSRMISSQALVSGIPEPANRGAFMAVSSCIQQLSGGVASAVAGLIVVSPPSGPLQRFDVLGDVVVAAVA